MIIESKCATRNKRHQFRRLFEDFGGRNPAAFVTLKFCNTRSVIRYIPNTIHTLCESQALSGFNSGSFSSCAGRPRWSAIGQTTGRKQKILSPASAVISCRVRLSRQFKLSHTMWGPEHPNKQPNLKENIWRGKFRKENIQRERERKNLENLKKPTNRAPIRPE